MYLNTKKTLTYLLNDETKISCDSKYFAILILIAFFLAFMISGGLADISPKLPSIIYLVSLALLVLIPIASYFILKSYLLILGKSAIRYIAILSVPSLFKSSLIAAILLLLFTAVRAYLFEMKMAKLPFDAGFYATTATIVIAWLIFIGNMKKSLNALKSNLNA
ncbi:MAG: hypothetical protein CVV22_09200 [Ignavibacteriae bacterium HGW-Ignavibacteriae-1]|jgi:hypothetical protein|nr:MAG: hypothetical protein CVV22_09200 [Ignavibacteriae bacterium HGW-Ignavibacteriae-1]